MTATIGRRVKFYWDGEIIPGMREKSVSASGEAIDVTDDDSSAWRTLLDEAGINQVDVGGSGVIKSDMLRAAWFAGLSGSTLPGTIKRQAPGRVLYADGGELNGDFNLISYNETGPYQDAMTFEAQFQSSGPVVYTAGAVPANTVLPSIAGTPQDGEVLTAHPGQWTGAWQFAYQWQTDAGMGWVNIVGATARTYTPVVGQVGQPLRVRVTATNSEGSVTADSASTIDVVAAD